MSGIPDLRNSLLTLVNGNQATIGDPELVSCFMQAERGAGELQQQLQRLGENGHISLTFVPGPVRALLLQGLESMPPEVSTDLRVLAENVQLIAARAQVDTNPVINVLIQTSNEQEAEATEASWNRLVNLFIQEGSRQIFRGRIEPDMIKPMQAYADVSATKSKPC